MQQPAKEESPCLLSAKNDFKVKHGGKKKGKKKGWGQPTKDLESNPCKKGFLRNDVFSSALDTGQ